MSAISAVVGAAVGLAFAPWSSMLVERPPLVSEEVEPLGLPFRCGSCHTALTPLALIPVLSFFLRRGVCEACQAKIPRRELINDLLCIVVGAITGATVGLVAALPAMLLVALVLVPVSLVDLERRKIATKLVYPAAAAVAVMLTIAAAIDGSWTRLLRAGAAGAAASLLLWVLWLVVPGGMGDGDARLMLMLGFALGWYGWLEVLWGVSAGFFLGSFVGIGFGIYTKKYLKAQLPFGPWLGLGAMLLVWMRA
jgi:leader peptidase (prepilin peptidase) / N-methyltransferase